MQSYVITPPGFFHTLPFEIINIITDAIDLKSCYHLMLTSRWWCNILNQERWWSQRYHRDHLLPITNVDDNWKNLYRRNTRVLYCGNVSLPSIVPLYISENVVTDRQRQSHLLIRTTNNGTLSVRLQIQVKRVLWYNEGCPYIFHLYLSMDNDLCLVSHISTTSSLACTKLIGPKPVQTKQTIAKNVQCCSSWNDRVIFGTYQDKDLYVVHCRHRYGLDKVMYQLPPDDNERQYVGVYQNKLYLVTNKGNLYWGEMKTKIVTMEWIGHSIYLVNVGEKLVSVERDPYCDTGCIKVQVVEGDSRITIATYPRYTIIDDNILLHTEATNSYTNRELSLKDVVEGTKYYISNTLAPISDK